MTDPISYQGVSPRHALPLLFAAQAQKEVVVNDALARVDSLLHMAVQGQANSPPASPGEGEAWLVDSAPAGSWVGHDGEIAIFSGGDWLYAAPVGGMTCWRLDERRFMHFDGGWSAAATVTAPAGGSVVDSEARQAIESMIDALKAAGLLPA